jgi:adenosine deaminase
LLTRREREDVTTMTTEQSALVTRELEQFIRTAPKVELHLHIEGTLEPELLLALADRHGVAVPYRDVDDLRAAYRFTDLQSFLDIYYQGAAVLLDAHDFEELTWAYLTRMAAENVQHVEIFFDPQTHTDRGVRFDEVVDGIAAALRRAERELGITSGLIACLLRHLGPEAAVSAVSDVLRRDDAIIGIGLDSSERGFPPEPYASLFNRARVHGLHTVAHAGEEGPSWHITGALDALQAERIDHGIRCLDDPSLVARLADERVPLTVCPLSNLALCVVDDLRVHPLRRLLDAGLTVTVNSDDPAYFGGYLTENFVQVAAALDFGVPELARLFANAIDASFVSPRRKAALHAELTKSVPREPFM